MPFGLFNIPASFQRMMNSIFGDLIGKNALVYIDDLTIFSKTFDAQIEDLREVFKRLREKGIYLNS